MSHKPSAEISVAGRRIGPEQPTYFIADIAANHDGDLGRARELIHLAAEAGADAAKFQHFKAETIVSDLGFRSLGAQQSHQSGWKKSVFEIYKDASLDVGWTPALKQACDKAGITFLTAPYALDLVDAVDPYIPAYKIGSGDITWTEILSKIAGKGKPVFLATGASSGQDVERAVATITALNSDLVLMQCNTNYTASLENFRYVQLNVLRSYTAAFPGMILGLSDHTPGHATVLGAVTLGARVIEKHFTDDVTREGPDHAFSMDPRAWREMVQRTRELESALGDELKKVEDNERETVVLQRRSIRTRRDLPAGTVLRELDLTVLRPCPTDGLPPYCMPQIVGRTLTRGLKMGEHLTWTDLK